VASISAASPELHSDDNSDPSLLGLSIGESLGEDTGELSTLQPASKANTAVTAANRLITCTDREWSRDRFEVSSRINFIFHPLFCEIPILNSVTANHQISIWFFGVRAPVVSAMKPPCLTRGEVGGGAGDLPGRTYLHPQRRVDQLRIQSRISGRCDLSAQLVPRLSSLGSLFFSSAIVIDKLFGLTA